MKIKELILAALTHHRPKSFDELVDQLASTNGCKPTTIRRAINELIAAGQVRTGIRPVYLLPEKK